jgi:hypothetical protein
VENVGALSRVFKRSLSKGIQKGLKKRPFFEALMCENVTSSRFFDKMQLLKG